MKNIAFIIIFSLSSYYFATVHTQCTVNRFCLSFANPVINSAASEFEFDIVMGSNQDFGLGTSNIQFRYNNEALSNPTIVSTVLEPPTYQPTSITTPFIPNINEFIGSLNLELNTTETGILIPVAGTTLARIKFTITNPALLSELSWYYNGGTIQTIVYDDDETTQLCSVVNDNTCLVPLSSILPINLSAFNITPKESSFQLSWVSQEEMNFKGFILERSARNTTNFEEISFIEGKGNNRKSEYDYEDKEVSSGTRYYYRLKMVDLDGSFSYSNIVSGQLNGLGKEVKLFPNPISSFDGLNVQTDLTGTSTFIIWDANNKRVRKIEFECHTIIDLKDYASGIYYYQLLNNNFTKNGYFSVVK